MKTSATMLTLLILASALPSRVWAKEAKASQLFCQEASQEIVDFSPGTLPFPNLTNITDEFVQDVLVFSADDSDLPFDFQKSQGAQENLINDRTFFNLFRLNFVDHKRLVVSVSVTLGDHNGNRQTHTLTAFDSSGAVLGSASFTERELFAGEGLWWCPA
jgi:hypothetical protein